jgi:hypothetical protein
MPGKRVKFDDHTWEAIEAVAHDSGSSFQAASARPMRLCNGRGL